jgi:type I restriction-modification system DNA methylase subunit
MNSVQIEENVKSLVKHLSSQEISKADFVYELLLAYGHRKSVVSRVKSGERNLSKNVGEVILKRHLYFKPCKSNLFAEIDAIKNSKIVANNKIRFVVVTDFSQLIAIDTKTQDTLDIELSQLAKHFDFFLPWAGMEKMVYRGENPADVKAAEKMAEFFDHIKETNYPANATKEQLHELVVFLNRLLFCFFAEDTKIFSENQFTNLLNQHTQEDGSDLNGLFERLFEVFNTPAHQRNDLPQYLNSFPYVNGGLFKKGIKVPNFDAKARRMLLDSGSLDWSDINPDIFGSMIQGVANPETRSKMGMHYTSVSNIMKVIEPLFLNDLYEEFDKCNDNINKLKKLQVRLSRIKFFDPACGSGNFLIITYKEIRELEIEILKRIRELEGESDSGMMGLFDESHSAIRLDQFYGIELDDFAHEMAILSLWLVEHQMNMVFETEFGYTAPTLPLKQSGRIVAGNATRIDWELVCPSTDEEESYILGNPPYIGSKVQNKEQKLDVKDCFDSASGYKSMDYISCWFFKAALFIKNKNSQFSFVSTNSICQGEQVKFWEMMVKLNLEISFCHTAFKWSNNAKNNAGVTCVIIGIRNVSSKSKFIFSGTIVKEAKNINPYLVDSENSIIKRRTTSISGLPLMLFGSIPYDGGHLLFTVEEKDEITKEYPGIDKFFRKAIGAKELLSGKERWCLWIEDEELNEALNFEVISEQLEKVRAFRMLSPTVSTQQAASYPHRFKQNTYKGSNSSIIIIPRVSSERREYLPVDIWDGKTITVDAQVIYSSNLVIFSLLSSKIHLAWVKATSGQLETRIRYSSAVSYNNFPLPKLTEEQENELVELAIEILAARELYPEMSLAKLYDPELMPLDLKAAHEKVDLYFDSLYSKKPLNTDSERLECLFRLYNKM